MNVLFFLSWQNAFLLIIDALLVALFAWYILRKFAAGLLRSDPTKVAWGLCLSYGGWGLERLEVVLDLYGWHMGAGFQAARLLMAVWAVVCLLRVFAGVVWGVWMWSWVVITAFVIATALVLPVWPS